MDTEHLYWFLMDRIINLTFEELESMRSQKGYKILLNQMLAEELYEDRAKESIRGELIIFHAILNVREFNRLQILRGVH